MASNKHTVITRPSARTAELLVQHVESETVVFDERTKTAHALRPLAAAVFMYADGDKTIEEIAELASYRLATEVSDAEVGEAVAQLEESGLLEEPTGLLSQGISRRTALKTFAAAGAGTMLVSSIVAPFASANQLTNYGLPYTCNFVSGSAYMTDSGNTSSGPKATGPLTPNGWALPYGAAGGSMFQMAATGTVGGPESSKDWYLGHSCIAAINSKTVKGKTTKTTVYGTYQVVPCDGDTNGYEYSCADVVCVPTQDGTSINSGGTATFIPGAVTSIGPGNNTMFWNSSNTNFAPPGGAASPAYGPYDNYAYNNNGYYFKVCCGNGIDKSHNGGTCGHTS